MFEKIFANVNRRIEFYRRINDKLVLIDIDEKPIDLVVNDGLDALCGCAFDASASRPAAFQYIALGTVSTAPSATDSALGGEVMRTIATYTKASEVGACTLTASFDITASYSLCECGIFNASSGGTLYCRDTFATRNVVSGDVVKVYYTGSFAAG